MKAEDILDAKVGSSQVTAIYLGNTLIWPTVAYTYEITGAVLNFSSGYRLDAGAVGSLYTGNYAWVTGTVVPYRGDEPQTPLTNVMLVPTVTNTSDFVVRDTYYIYGHNLGTTPTATIKETSVDVTYKTSDDFRVGSTVTQTRNIETVTDGTPYIVDGTPYTTVDPIANSYWVVLNLSQYGNRMYPCPAYGNPSVSLVCYGGHDEATFSHTPWQEFTPRIHSFSSGSSYTINEETDYGEYPPVQVGQSEGVNDDLSENIELTFSPNGGSGWASYNYTRDLLTIDNAGTTEYQLRRYVTITATNGNATESVTAYQQGNFPETTDYYVSIVINEELNIPHEGGVFTASYESNIVTTYTSGTPTNPIPVNAEVTASSNVTLELDEPTVSGSGLLFFSVSENDSTTLWQTVEITLNASGHTATATANQEPQPVITVPSARVYPTLDENNRPCLNFKMTYGQFPSGGVVLSGVQYWYLLEESSSGEPTPVSIGTVNISQDNQRVVVIQDPYLPGTSGLHYFSATAVSSIGKSNTTFPTDYFDIMEL